MEPEVKMLMQYRKEWLEQIAGDRELDASGTKIELAERIAAHDSDRSQRAWRAIVDGGKED